MEEVLSERTSATMATSTQWWTRCTQPRTAHFPRQRGRETRSPRTTLAEETVSALVKLAKEIDEPYDISQPGKLITQREELRPVQGSAEDTEERVMTSHTKKCEKSESCAKELQETKMEELQNTKASVSGSLTKSNEQLASSGDQRRLNGEGNQVFVSEL